MEIIRIVERSHLPTKVTLDKLGVSRPTFYRWYDLYQQFGTTGLEDKRSGPNRAWNPVPDKVRAQLIDLALDEPELSPRELAVTFTDTQSYFVSESSVYRLLKAHDLITSPAFIVMKAVPLSGACTACRAVSEFKDKTTAINQLWQTDFTYLKVIALTAALCLPAG